MASNFYSLYPAMAAPITGSNAKWPIHEQHCHKNDGHYDDSLVRLNLEREGHCPDCGIQTHRLHHNAVEMTSTRGGPSSAVLVHKEPLTIGSEVYNGRCLMCRPTFTDGHVRHSNYYTGYDFMSYASRAPSQAQQPQQQIHRAISHEQEEEQPHIIQQHETNDIDDDEILSILFRMLHSPHDLPLQISCFHSLYILSWETENARAIGRVGGIPILLESLRYHLDAHVNINNRYNRNNHTSSPSALQRMQLQGNGLATLQNLSVNKYNKELLVEHNSSGIPLILLSMTTFLHSPDIVCSGCNAVANILSNSGCYRRNILNHGGLNAVLQCVDFHQDNEGVVQAAYRCLCLLGQKMTMTRECQGMEKGVTTDEEWSILDGNNGSVEEEEDDDDSMLDMDTSARSALSTHLEER